MKELIDNELEIGELSVEDSAAIFQLSQDELNARFLPDEVFLSLQDAETVVASLITNYSKQEYPLVYSVKLHGVHIGHVELVKIPEGVEIGYFIGSPYRGKGYANRACKMFVGYVISRFGLDKLYGICASDNYASKKVLKYCGFELIEYRQSTNKEVYVLYNKITKNETI
ncbi:MAG: GNAT family N-acetyltransferase [Corallococcus sp.]|nr:GNAT family N-acetyltransferase [Corallococcus sp.]MCM1359438.1 GNAT family N-acetyltransferase [Corallococcus sp.]MCM1394750.1 GNAT family N-acetyltransferase [Corallococcus sp.]